MEGDLIEVTMDEETQLWQLLTQDAEISLAFEKSGKEEEEPEIPDKAKSTPEQQVCGTMCPSLSSHKLLLCN